MTGTEILMAIKLAKLGTDAVSNIGAAWRAKREAKDLEESPEFKAATKASKKALGKLTDPKAYAAGEAETGAAAEKHLRQGKPLEEAASAELTGPSTTEDVARRDQLLKAVTDLRTDAMQAGRGDVLTQKLAEQARDKDIFQIGQSFQDRLAQIKGGGRQAMASGLTTLGAGATVLGGKAIYDQYKADRDDSTPAAFGTDEEIAKTGSTDLLAGVGKTNIFRQGRK
jgi:hypothetical protein